MLIVDDSDVVVGGRWVLGVGVDIRGFGWVGEGVAVHWLVIKGLIWRSILW